MQVPITELAKAFGRTVSHNSPAILTAVAVTGTVSTAVLAAQGAFRAAEIIADQEPVWDDTTDPGIITRVELTRREKFDLTWKCYIPAGITAGTTIGCIIGATTISSRRSAAIMSAYSLTEKAFSEYKDKVVEQIGINKEQKVVDSIAEDRMKKDPIKESNVVIMGDGDVMCYETLSGRYFKSNMETIRKAQNDCNSRILNDMYVSLNEFWEKIGLEPTSYGEEAGWNTDRMIETQFSSILSNVGAPCLSIGYRHMPFPNYHHMH